MTDELKLPGVDPDSFEVLHQQLAHVKPEDKLTGVICLLGMISAQNVIASGQRLLTNFLLTFICSTLVIFAFTS